MACLAVVEGAVLLLLPVRDRTAWMALEMRLRERVATLLIVCSVLGESQL